MHNWYKKKYVAGTYCEIKSTAHILLKCGVRYCQYARNQVLSRCWNNTPQRPWWCVVIGQGGCCGRWQQSDGFCCVTSQAWTRYQYGQHSPLPPWTINAMKMCVGRKYLLSDSRKKSTWREQDSRKFDDIEIPLSKGRRNNRLYAIWLTSK